MLRRVTIISVDLVHGGSGIELYTNGAITANNIYTTGNLKYGMKLDNCNYSGSACLSTYDRSGIRLE